MDTLTETHRVTYISSSRLADGAVQAEKISDAAICNKFTLYADGEPVEVLEIIREKG